MAKDEKVVSLGSKRSKNKKEKESEKRAEQKKDEKVTGSEPVYCSFCGRPNTQVVKMVKGPGVNICSECTMIAVQYLILQDRMPSAEAQSILDAFWGKCR